MEQPGIKKQLVRKLTDVFGMVKKRDAMLGDLYYSLRTEEFSAHAENLIFDLAYLYHKSSEVGSCLASVIDHIEETSGPGRAYSLTKRLADFVVTGPVYTEMVRKLNGLQKKAESELLFRKLAISEIDRIRLGSIEERSSIASGWFSYLKPDKVIRPVDLVLKPMSPHQFNAKLQSWGDGLKQKGFR